ncbi:MAG: hypothetical protein A2X30_01585 [Elusimicrobia bacterium GWB2_63_16]|nr:MAG: hypothetical protein A2X30_01585 [Elusimicrobia bacterium GWB2_63_16]
MKASVFAAIICAGIVTSGYATDENTDIATFIAKDITGINVRTTSGDIHVDTQKRTDIQVEQLPDNKTACDVSMEVIDGTLVLKAIEKDGIHGRIKTGFRVYLPSALPVLAGTVSGDIKISEIFAPVKATTVSGDVKLVGITGAVDAKTTSGDIRLTKVQGPVRTETISGDIHGTFAKNAQIAVEATTTSGKVRNAFADKTGISVIAHTTSGNITLAKE